MGNNINSDPYRTRKNYDRTVHLAVIVNDSVTGLTYFTKCGKTSSRANRTTDIDKVTCKKCLT